MPKIESAEVAALLTEDAVRDILRDCVFRANAHIVRVRPPPLALLSLALDSSLARPCR